MKLIHISNTKFVQADQIKIPDIYFRRVFTGMSDLDDVFGGSGILPGCCFTIAASAGTGKTTFLLQVEELLAAHNNKKCGYISGEESSHQLAFTCQRINVKKVQIANLTNIDEICAVIRKEKFAFVVIDSLPAMTTTEEMNPRERETYIAEALTAAAKETETIIGLILHMTKGGQYKGGVSIAHSSDMNILMKVNDEDPSIREITVTKNRFGFAGQTSFLMGSNGFDFVKVESAMGESSGRPDRKPSKKDEVMALIKEKGKVDQNSIIQLTGSVQYTNNIVRELMITGLIQKTGKGGTAEFSLVSK